MNIEGRLDDIGITKRGKNIVKLPTAYDENTNIGKNGNKRFFRRNEKDEFNNEMYIDPNKSDLLAMNFGQVPYYNDKGDKRAIDELRMIKEISEKGYFGKLFDKWAPDGRHLQLAMEMKESEEDFAFQTYLSDLLYKHQNHPFVRDLISKNFPGYFNKRDDFIKENIDFYRQLAKMAVYGIPRNQKDFFWRYYLALKDEDGENVQFEGWENNKYDRDTLVEMMTRNYWNRLKADGTLDDMMLDDNELSQKNGLNEFIFQNMMLNKDMLFKYNHKNDKLESNRPRPTTPLGLKKMVSPTSDNYGSIGNYKYTKPKYARIRNEENNFLRKYIIGNHKNNEQDASINSNNLMTNKFIIN